MIAFFLGSHPSISLAELRVCLNLKEVEYTNEVAFFDAPAELGLKLFSLLGGTPKWGEVIAQTGKDTQDIEEKTLEVVKNDLAKESRKEYVLSLYGVRIDKRDFHHELKGQLQGAKYDGKFEERYHSPAAVEHVIKRGGFEYSVISAANAIYFIKTIQVQDTKYWSMIDGERPARDMKIGMLPSKLARMMLNLSCVEGNGKVWDPFVGQATIAMQSVTRGISVLGTDNSRISIDKSKRNMQWMTAKGMGGQVGYTIKDMSIERPVIDRAVTTIVTEPFLGKPHFKPYTTEFLAKREWRPLERLYSQLLLVANRTLRPGQRIVFVKPIYAFLAGRDVKWYNPPLSISNSWRVPESLRDLGHLLWVQKDSVVGREIIVLEKR